MKEVINLLEQLALVFKESETRPTTNGHMFINYELEFDLNNLYSQIEEEIICMLDERDDIIHSQPIEEANNMQINDVVVDRVRFKDIESALVTFKQYLEQRPTNITLAIQSIQILQKKLES